MKKIFYSILAIAAVISTASCANEETAGRAINFTGVTAQLDTRTELSPADGGYNINWIKGDAIAVVGTDGNPMLYVATSGGSTVTTFKPYDPSGNFSPEDMDVDNLGSLSFPTRAEAGQYKAYYPASIAGGELPAVQDYVEGNIHTEPMVADNSNDPTTFNFKQIGGIMKLCISTSASGVKVRSIIVTADQGLSGAYVMQDDAAVIYGTDGVTLDCGEEGVAISSTAVPFHISVPANTYSGLVIRILTTDNRMSVIKLQDNTVYTVRRSELREINLSANNFGAAVWTDKKAVLMQGVDFNETIKRMAGSIIQQSDSDSNIKTIVFRTNDNSKGEVRMEDPCSEVPVYAALDKATGTLTVWTAADVIYTGRNASALFEGLAALTRIDNLAALNTSEADTFYRMFHGCSSLKSVDVSTFSTENIVDMRYMFYQMSSCETIDVSSFDITRLATERSMDYMFRELPKLKEIRFGAKGEHSVPFRPSYFFCASDDTFSVRTSSSPKKLTIYCTKLAASWLADTQLRWINSGYSGKTKIPVTFIDYKDGVTVYKPTWAGN